MRCGEYFLKTVMHAKQNYARKHKAVRVLHVNIVKNVVYVLNVYRKRAPVALAAGVRLGLSANVPMSIWASGPGLIDRYNKLGDEH